MRPNSPPRCSGRGTPRCGSVPALWPTCTFLATCRPGDTIIAPLLSIGGHVTHHAAGAAGLYGLKTVPAPVDANGYTVNVDGLRALAHEVRPALITLGSSLNLFPHRVAAVREITVDTNGLRLGTPEVARLGMTPDDMPDLARFIARGLDPEMDPSTVAADVTAWRARFSGVAFTAG